MSKTTIIIADDHKLFIEGVESLLAKHSDEFEIVAKAKDGEELLKLLDTLSPDIVLTDISMPHKTGIQVIEESRKKHPNIKFIVLSMHEDGQYIVKSVKAGAYSYLLKNVDEEELFTAIKTVARGKKYYTEYISKLLIENMSDDHNAYDKITTRESEVLKLVAEGKTTKEIADTLFISTRTVETHRVNLMKKLQAQNTAELIKKATDFKLI